MNDILHGLVGDKVDVRVVGGGSVISGTVRQVWEDAVSIETPQGDVVFVAIGQILTIQVIP